MVNHKGATRTRCPLCSASGLMLAASIPFASILPAAAFCPREISSLQPLGRELSTRFKHPRPYGPVGPSGPHSSVRSGAIAVRSVSVAGTGLGIRNLLSYLPPGSPGRILRVAAGVLIFAGYHFQIVVRERQGVKSWCSHQADLREDWSKYVRETKGWLYAIQTLRNAITTNTFLTSTVITLLALISGKIWDILRNMPVGTRGRRTLVLQFLSIALCMLTSAYHFLQSARLMTHAGFMFPALPQDSTLVDAMIRKSEIKQWLGLRYLYLSLSAIVWAMGGETMFLVSSVALVLFFRNIDLVPVDLRNEKS